jgi:3-hydroxybutyrate dehydrogenase
MNALDFSGKTVLVTGASRGIGRAIAEAFVGCGATTHVLADDPGVHDTARELGATPHQADITERNVLQRALADIGRLDVLINNAGLERLTPLDASDAQSEATFRRVIEVNIVGTYLATQASLGHMEANGSIVNTASVWGRMPAPLFGAYVASKHAVIGLTKTWAKELGPRRIRVNAVCPGWVKTEASMLSLERMAARDGVAQDALLASIVGNQAFGGLMAPQDVAGAYLFLASDLAANVTGQSFGVDRGEYPV